MSTEDMANPNPPELSPEELFKAQIQEKENKYLYLYAEFENYKKRAFRERQEAARFGWESVAREFLEVLDNLDRAVAHSGASVENSKDPLKLGLVMVVQQFKAALQRHGVQPLGAIGKPFDPHFHEAVSRESSSAIPEGSVVREEVPGYLIHDRLLRPARVVVSDGNSRNPELTSGKKD
ncbi:MAG: nucleotide exchange factor GrpE [Bdellovibrionota bacterium]